MRSQRNGSPNYPATLGYELLKCSERIREMRCFDMTRAEFAERIASAGPILWNSARMEIGAEILLRTNALLNSGPFLLPALTGRMSPVPAWLLLPLLWKFVAFQRGIPFSSAFESP